MPLDLFIQEHGYRRDAFLQVRFDPGLLETTDYVVIHDGFMVRLGGCAYSIKSKEPDAVTARILDVEAPNRNGIYKVGLLEKKGGSIGCEIRLTQVAPAE